MTPMPNPRTLAAAAAYVALSPTDTVLAGRTGASARRARFVAWRSG